MISMDHILVEKMMTIEAMLGDQSSMDNEGLIDIIDLHWYSTLLDKYPIDLNH